jgi:DNA modification methylase
MQLDFFETVSDNGKDKAAFSDPNFAGNKTKPVHRWVPWIAGFASEFVKNVIDDNLEQHGVVLDPFAGVGTTLIEAYFAGHEVLGFEINPYATLACRVKLNAGSLDAEKLRETTLRLRTFFEHSMSNGYRPKSTAPRGFKTRVDFYSPRVLHRVLIIQDFINAIDDRKVAEVFQLVFAATMVSYSNYSYEPSLGTRQAVGKSEVEDASVIDKLMAKLAEIVSDVTALSLNGLATRPAARVVNDSFFRCKEYAAGESVDLCVTSPPYLNNYHYIRNTRPQLYWLGFAASPRDTQHLEQDNFGKYWQTVRELTDVPLDFPNPPEALVAQLNRLRTLKSDRGIYGGNGWANYAASYFNDCYRFAQCLNYILKPGGQAFVVIGNSILQGIMIPTDQYLGEIAEHAGLQFTDIQVPRQTRVGNSIIQSDVRVEKAEDNHRLYESVVHLTKKP